MRGTRRLPTIVDVARVAQVSVPTVSRVLTGSTPVRDVTRARVLAAMDELQYRPNGAARALVHGHQPIVGVIMPNTSSYGHARIVTAIEQAARAAGYLVAVTLLDPLDVDAMDRALEVLLTQPIVGVIVVHFHEYDTARLRQRLGTVPISTIVNGSRPFTPVPSVVVDDRRAARELTEFLLDLGHAVVHHVAVPGNDGQPHARELGWREALSARGVPVPAVQMTDWSLEAGARAGAALAHDPAVTAVVCSNDELAFAVMRSLQHYGRAVPDQVSVVGMDDIPLAQFARPGLTTFRLDFDHAGTEAFALLSDSAASRGQTVTGSELIIRNSAASAPTQ